MDEAKCRALKEELGAEPDPQLVPVDRFFDGNDDAGSIGCNLADHPGIEAFRDVFNRLLQRPDVAAIYAQISELDPGEGSWPFTDTVVVVGTIPLDALSKAVRALQPDEIGYGEQFVISPEITRRHGAGAPVRVLWWD